MSKATGPQSTIIKETIAACDRQYRKTKAPAWKRLVDELQKSSRNKREMNLHQLEKLAKQYPKKVIVVMGKVLGNGSFSADSTVCAFSFSSGAKEAISKKGKALNMMELASNPKPVNEWVMVQ